MGLIRLIIFAAVVFLVIQLVRRWLNQPDKTTAISQDQGEMIRCAHCGLYIPRAEAITSGERSYCSVEHRDADHPHD